MLLLAISVFLLPVLAQRPSNASQCDYYATQLFGSNTTTTQFNLVQSILALAFAGGSGVSNVSSDITGIFNPGTFHQASVNLQPWFDGSIDSTNLNNQPSNVDWLNGGGNAPLTSYLTGKTSSVELSNRTNEYQFMIHQYAALQGVISCSLPTPLPANSGGIRNLAYVHKFMDLNYTEIGHFINQISLSAIHFGFSQQDGDQISTQLNAKFNNRCSPPDSTGQLYSLCQDASCPLASDPDCGAYEPSNLGINGAISSSVASSILATATSQFVPSSTSTSAPATTSTPSSSSSSSSLSTGGIVGIAIGGAALIFAFIIALVWLSRRKKSHSTVGDQPDNYKYSPSFPPSSVAQTDPHSSWMSNQRVKTWNGPSLEPWREPPEPVEIAEMEHPGSPETGYRSRSEMDVR